MPQGNSSKGGGESVRPTDVIDPVSVQCTAKARSTQERCKGQAVPGLNVCYQHGGAPKGSQEAAMARSTTATIEQFVAVYGEPRTNITAEEAMAEELARTAGHVAWLEERLRQQDPTTFIKSMWMYKRQSGYVSPDEVDNFAWNAAGAVWIELYMKERAHLLRTAEVLIRSGFEERRVRLAEKMADQLGESVTWLLVQLGHDVDDPVVREKAFTALQMASGREIVQSTAVSA